MITIYSTPICPRCKILKDAFQKAGIPYREYQIGSEAISECLCDTGEHVREAPLVKGGHLWFFADDFFDPSGNLKANWLVELKWVRPHQAGFSGSASMEDKKQECSKIWRDDK